MTKIQQNNNIQLSALQISQLERQGCYAKDWSTIMIDPTTDLSLIRNVRFYGDVQIGSLIDADIECGLFNAVVRDCKIGNNVYINNVGGELRGCRIGDNVRIDNVGRIVNISEAACGLGTPVCVLDETGSRPVYIYPGISAQMAALMAYKPQFTEDVLLPKLQDLFVSRPLSLTIGNNVSIIDTVSIFNVHIDANVKIEGAQHLKNGAVINNSTIGESLAYVGTGVDAENFIIEDAEVSTNATLRNCYVGQGCAIVKGFTAHDSLFFANSVCENGEACAIFAGPHTVSMHKSSLLIGAQYMFMNAGSGTNSSNHMYKLGPSHWGIMERGVKTSSDAYMMWQGKIGAFSLLMGSHKTHPDTSPFPFSYLFSNEKNETIVVPGIMLKSCGLLRDATKWPARDKRSKYGLPFNDNVCYEVLNPQTVGTMIVALQLFDEIESTKVGEDGMYCYNGLKLKPSSVSKGREYYRQAILKYFYEKTHNVDISTYEPEDMQWIDFVGQIIPIHIFETIYKKDSLIAISNIFKQAFKDYHELELKWIAYQMQNGWKEVMHEAKTASEKFDEAIQKDRQNSRQMLKDQNKLLSV